jgi:hypothetical protein
MDMVVAPGVEQLIIQRRQLVLLDTQVTTTVPITASKLLQRHMVPMDRLLLQFRILFPIHMLSMLNSMRRRQRRRREEYQRQLQVVSVLVSLHASVNVLQEQKLLIFPHVLLALL